MFGNRQARVAIDYECNRARGDKLELATSSVPIEYNVYICVHVEVPMEPVKVGIREFRERLAAYVLESDAPVAVTRHGDTVGYFIPARRKRSVTERAALKEAAAQLDALLAAKDITEDELVAEFKSRRAAKHR